jgi:hypothetical protein
MDFQYQIMVVTRMISAGGTSKARKNFSRSLLKREMQIRDDKLHTDPASI